MTNGEQTVGDFFADFASFIVMTAEVDLLGNSSFASFNKYDKTELAKIHKARGARAEDLSREFRDRTIFLQQQGTSISKDSGYGVPGLKDVIFVSREDFAAELMSLLVVFRLPSEQDQ